MFRSKNRQSVLLQKWAKCIVPKIGKVYCSNTKCIVPEIGKMFSSIRRRNGPFHQKAKCSKSSCVYRDCRCKLKYQLLWVPTVAFFFFFFFFYQVLVDHTCQSVLELVSIRKLINC